MTTTIHFSGLNTQPASLIHPASDSPLGVGPRTSLLIWWLTFNQVGLESLLILTHWVTLSSFIPPSGNPNDLSLSRHDQRLVSFCFSSYLLSRKSNKGLKGQIIIIICQYPFQKNFLDKRFLHLSATSSRSSCSGALVL